MGQLIIYLTMRFIRPAINKQNREPASQLGGDRGEIQKLRHELKSAYAQINQLKQTNSKLQTKLEGSQQQVLNLQEMKEELEFLREQETNCKQQLDNYVVINRKLREELERYEKERNETTQLNQTKTELQTRREKEIKQPTYRQNSCEKNTSIGRSATAHWQQSMRISSSCISNSSERPKDNHVSTPKSKMRINLQEFIPTNVPQRKRVFL